MKIIKIIALIVAVLTLYLFVRVVDIQQVLASVGQIGYNFIILILVTGTAYWLAAYGWKFCIPGDLPLSVTDLFFVRHLGEMVSIINPAGILGGEAVKVYLLSEKGLKKTNTITSLMISRVLMALSQILLFTLTCIVVLLSGHHFLRDLPSVPFRYYLAVPLIIVLICLACRSIYLRKIVSNLKVSQIIKRLWTKYQVKETVTEFRVFWKGNKKGLYIAFLFFSMHWITGSLEIYFILKFLGIKAGILPVLFVDMGIVLFKSAGVLVPGQLGIEEFANKVMLLAIGLPDTQVWITVSVLRRARQLFWILLGGLVYLIYLTKYKLPRLS